MDCGVHGEEESDGSSLVVQIQTSSILSPSISVHGNQVLQYGTQLHIQQFLQVLRKQEDGNHGQRTQTMSTDQNQRIFSDAGGVL
jgi:hypothetical protein